MTGRWLKENQKCYLSHFFVQLDDKLKAITNWDIGYYNPITKKIIIFSLDEASKSFSIKPADDVFKKESDIVERLEVSVVKLSLEEAKDRCCEELPKQFPKESYGGGFLILQNWKKTVVWNFWGRRIPKNTSMIRPSSAWYRFPVLPDRRKPGI